MSAEFFQLLERLVPESGQAATVQGEVVRAIGRLADEFAVNGLANWDAGYERLAAFALRHLTDGTFGPQPNDGILSDTARIQAYGRKEDTHGYDLEAAFDRLMQATVRWCKSHMTPIPHNLDPELKR